MSVVREPLVEDGESSGDEEDEAQDDNFVCNPEVVKCFKKCWMTMQNNVDAVQLVRLRRMIRTFCTILL